MVAITVHLFTRIARISTAVAIGLILTAGVLFFTRIASSSVYAAPIEPPEGYPKLITSVKTVTPTLVNTGGESLLYRIEIRNTGAYTAQDALLADVIPANTTYNDDAASSVLPAPSYANGILSWMGTVGFDSSVIISFSVDVASGFEGIISNTAVISHPLISKPVLMTANALVTDDPLLKIEKTSAPLKPGPSKPITYTLVVANYGQPATNLPVTVTDLIPQNTTFLSVGPDGSFDPSSQRVTWNRILNLGHEETSSFTFSVMVDDVPSGTVIYNEQYNVSNPVSGIATGEVYTVTVIDPIFLISKSVYPEPPGANSELTYTLTVLNKGSLATNLVVTDIVPADLTYRRGGSLTGDTVTWQIPDLDSGEIAQFSFTAYAGDIASITLTNEFYAVCSAEGVCQAGRAFTSTLLGPQFLVSAFLDPVAKHPGGGTAPVTPTLVVQNLGPGNALDATAWMYFKRISVQLSDMRVQPSRGSLSTGPSCGENCFSFRWIGNISAGETLTFTTNVGQNTIGGDEGTIYSATLVITDELGDYTTQPVSATATGKVTHYANLVPQKYAPPVIGAGQTMTYTIRVLNSGLSTDVPPDPWLTETVPVSTSLLRVMDGGSSRTIGDRTVISWTLPSLRPGGVAFHSFAVNVDDDLVSGTLIVNSQYRTHWYELEATGLFSNTGAPITTVVKEIGLIDSFKVVTPSLVSPGKGNILTYIVNVVNTSPMPLSDVSVYDTFPWQSSTYRRDAVASAGQIISDIVSLEWTGDVEAYSSERITFTVLVDEDYTGPVTNTAVISHETLREAVEVVAVAYVTDEPVLRISKTATPDPVHVDGEIEYRIRVTNPGQQATGLVISDTFPVNTEYVVGSAGSGAQVVGNQVRWQSLVLNPGESQVFLFRVKVLAGEQIVNQYYRVSCLEGVSAWGNPVITLVTRAGPTDIFLPFVWR